MTTVTIPTAVLDGVDAGTCDVTVQLVDARDRPLIGLRTSDGRPVTARAQAVLTEDGEDWDLDLTPQAQIPVPGGGATYYRIRISTETAWADIHYQASGSGTLTEYGVAP